MYVYVFNALLFYLLLQPLHQEYKGYKPNIDEVQKLGRHFDIVTREGTSPLSKAPLRSSLALSPRDRGRKFVASSRMDERQQTSYYFDGEYLDYTLLILANFVKNKIYKTY